MCRNRNGKNSVKPPTLRSRPVRKIPSPPGRLYQVSLGFCLIETAFTGGILVATTRTSTGLVKVAPLALPWDLWASGGYGDVPVWSG